MLNYFAAGRLVIALSKDCIIPANINDPVFDGIEAEKTEVLFQLQSLKNNSDIGALLLIHIKGKDKLSVIEAVEKLSANPCVVYARPDYLMFPHIIPNDPYYNRLWGMRKIHAPAAWSYTTGSSQVVVGVVDSGIEYNHPDLNNNMFAISDGQRLYGWNLYDNNYNPMDETGHGTHVAGTIGAVGNNFIGVAGVSWRVSMAALKIGNSIFSSSAAIRAIGYANKNKISILNCSWGSRAYCPCLRFAIHNYDGLLIASAGNDGSDNDNFPVFPASFECNNIISVAAATRNNTLAPFSNYGAISVGIAAPGSDIFSTSLAGGYSYMDGTSMAAPHVAGAAALLKAYRPNLSTLEMKKIIYSSVDKKSQFHGKVLSGGTLNINKMIEIAILAD